MAGNSAAGRVLQAAGDAQLGSHHSLSIRAPRSLFADRVRDGDRATRAVAAGFWTPQGEHLCEASFTPTENPGLGGPRLEANRLLSQRAGAPDLTIPGGAITARVAPMA